MSCYQLGDKTYGLQNAACKKNFRYISCHSSSLACFWVILVVLLTTNFNAIIYGIIEIIGIEGAKIVFEFIVSRVLGIGIGPLFSSFQANI